MPVEALNQAAATLPVNEILPDLRSWLTEARSAVVIAPPGAGKTTIVPLALLQADWLQDQKVLVLLPRRMAARAAAERMASIIGESAGEQIGYRTRLESRPGSRIECLTTGLFLNHLLRDAGLEGVGAIIFDEVHERSLDMDLALALVLEVQQLRDDLRLLAMSATVDGEQFSSLMEGARIFQSSGRSFPIKERYLGRSSGDIAASMATAIHTALAEASGSVLAFLPGVAEIERTTEQLRLPPDVMLHCLHSQVPPAAQQQALRPGGRKVVLATSIAETSLTIDGIRIVVDSGLARRPVFDRASGLSRLQTVRVSQAAARQRAGRAGRQAPGLVLRLWDEAETAGLLPFDPPEILQADMAPLLLRLAAWGVQDPADLHWLDSPPEAAVAAGRKQLQQLGALDADGGLTDHGQRMAKLPLSPASAHLLLIGAMHKQARTAADMALLLEERGLGGRSTDIEERLQQWQRDARGRGKQAKGLAQRWAKAAESVQPVRSDADPSMSAGLLLASAWPDRVARRRRQAGRSDQTTSYLLANGRGALLSATEPLARAEWLVVADAGGAGASSRIRLAAAIADEEIRPWLEVHGESRETLVRNQQTGRYQLRRSACLGAIEISATLSDAPPEALVRALLDEVQVEGLEALSWSDAERGVLARLRFLMAEQVPEAAAWPDLSDEGLLQAADDWLWPRVAGASSLVEVQLDGALLDWLGWETRQALEKLAPVHYHSPAGSKHVIDYTAEAGPQAEVRVQAMFGTAAHPTLADGRVRLLLSLTSPAGRPVANTRDIASFWQSAWRDVQKDMKGRYPKHPWPDDPLSAAPTLRSKAADRRRG